MEINIANLSQEELYWMLDKFGMNIEHAAKDSDRLIDRKSGFYCGRIEPPRLVVYIEERKK